MTELYFDEKELRRIFLDYVRRNYDIKDIRIDGKFQHSLFVASIAKEIAIREEMADEHIRLAWLAGLLHDIGRFPQITKYNTFWDKLSIPHAHIGCQMLFVQGLIRDFIPTTALPEGSLAYLELKDAIYQHSQKYLTRNKELIAISNDDRDPLWLHKVLRDADKIDIVRNTACVPKYSLGEDVFEKKDMIVSDKVVEQFITGEIIDDNDINNYLDAVINAAAFIYALEYRSSEEMLLEQGYIRHIFDIFDKFPQNKTNEELLNIRLREYISKLQKGAK